MGDYVVFVQLPALNYKANQENATDGLFVKVGHNANLVPDIVVNGSSFKEGPEVIHLNDDRSINRDGL